jgi:hypothetical protein
MATLLLIYFSVIVLIILFYNNIPSVIAMFPKWKYYKKIYNELPTYKFYRYDDIIYNYKFGSKEDGFRYDTYSNSFKLLENTYLHNNEVTKQCPYSNYWYKKYIKWFKENVDMKTLEDW